jgi:ATP-binding cassette subfamily B protein
MSTPSAATVTPTLPTLWSKLRQTARSIRLSARLVRRASPRLTAGILLLVFVEALLPPLSLLLYRLVVDSAIPPGHLAVQDTLARAWSPLGWILCAAVIVALSQLLDPIAQLLRDMAADRLTIYVTGQIIRAANRWRGLARFEDPDFADDLERARTSAGRGGLVIMTNSAYLAVHLLTLVSVLALLARLSPLAPALLLLTALPALAWRWEFIFANSRHLYQQTPDARRLEYYRDVTLDPEPAKDVRLYDLAPYFGRRYRALFDQTERVFAGERGRAAPRMVFASILLALGMAAIFLYAVARAAHGALTVGDLVLYGGALALAQSELNILAIYSGELPQELSFLPALFRILDAPADLFVPTPPLPAPRPIREGFVFEHVSFTYPGQATPTLRDISFRLAPGESVALVGQNGAGKTTIVKLLLRLYDPTSGRILLDGRDLREYDLDDLRQELSAVFQDFVRYELTAGENICLGNLDRPHGERAIRDAATGAGADSLLDTLPQGLATPVGREFNGRDLSGGEWQKLALARGILRGGQALVLDEPTAALDVATEYAIYQRFNDLTRDRMTLLISHRFSTVRMAARILFLAGGRIQESGSHAELLARDGDYARLYRIQAARYAEEG